MGQIKKFYTVEKIDEAHKETVGVEAKQKCAEDQKDDTPKEEATSKKMEQLNLEAQLISALDELRKERKKNEQLEKELIEQKEDEVSIDTLNMQLEVEVEQILTSQLEEKAKTFDAQEVEIISLKADLEKMNKAAYDTGKEVEELSELRKENLSLEEQLQKSQENLVLKKLRRSLMNKGLGYWKEKKRMKY